MRSITPRQRFRILNRDGFRCAYCGRTAQHGVTLHIDHVHPVSLGGTDKDDNLVTACDVCNLGKSDIPLTDRQAAPVVSIGVHTCQEWFANEAEARQYGCDHAGECGAPATHASHLEGYSSLWLCERHSRFYNAGSLYRLDSIPLPAA